MRMIATSVPAAAAMAVLAACNSSTSASPVVVCGPDNVATTDSDVVIVNEYEAAWYYASVDAIPVVFYDPSGASDPDAGTASSAAAASAVAAAVGTYFPNRCATASANGNVVTFVLTNCTGPLGLVATTGTVTATLTLQTNAVGVQLSGNHISANGATINLASSGTLTSSNGQKTLTANTQTTGTGPNGNSVAHTGMYTIVWTPGTGCATLNGTLNGSGDGGNVTSTQITNYVACTDKCPQSGSAVASFSGGGTVTLTFDGGTSAQCAASNGTSAALALQCP
ncbi:MAG TPA: hypothetical protein VEK07_16515 [Polyangiaceae bacterium]|nr:hypothetical protein [Polyangiaceae bacterium]